jgi:hypothetical protein
MSENSPSARAESAHPKFMFFGPMEAVRIWLLVMSATIEWNGKIFEIAATLNKEWFDFVSRELYAPVGTRKKEFGGMESIDGFRHHDDVEPRFKIVPAGSADS